MKLRIIGIAATLLCTTMFIAPARASNGINLIAYSGESLGVGGADVALIRDTSALAVNPAGLAQIEGSRLDLSPEPFYFFDFSHADAQNKSTRNQLKYGSFINGGYARRINSEWVAGIGLYLAGGFGFDYTDLDSGYGTRGDLVAKFTVLRLAPGASWQLNDQLSIGASLGINYALARQEVFANSSVLEITDLEKSLFGARLDGVSAFALNGIFGLKYAVSPGAVIGLSYRSPTKLNLKDGELTVNYQAFGAGRLVYEDTRLSGLSLPQDVQLGAIFSPARGWLLTTELNWIDWSRAVGDVTLSAGDVQSNPNPLLIPSEIRSVQPLQLKDQYVLSFGVIHALNEQTSLMAGYNYARQPVPAQNNTPLFTLLPEQHFTFGISRVLGEAWDLHVGVQYVARSSLRYNNPAFRYTQDARDIQHYISTNLTFTRHW